MVIFGANRAATHSGASRMSPGVDSPEQSKTSELLAVYVGDRLRPPFGYPIAQFIGETLKTEFSIIPADTRYSHWDVTGAAPARPSQATPLDCAIAFEQYRLMVVSAWPESLDKQERLHGINSALRRLELAR